MAGPPVDPSSSSAWEAWGIVADATVAVIAFVGGIVAAIVKMGNHKTKITLDLDTVTDHVNSLLDRVEQLELNYNKLTVALTELSVSLRTSVTDGERRIEALEKDAIRRYETLLTKMDMQHTESINRVEAHHTEMLNVLFGLKKIDPAP
jgi:hypothetical protein